MGLSITHLLIVLLVVLVVFGAGKLPQVMGDLGKGLRHFKQALRDDAPENHTPSRSRKKLTDSGDEMT